MPFTDHCDIFVAFHEDGFNRIIHHVMTQRPSLVNYATDDVLENSKLMCTVIRAHPIVRKRNNPIATEVDLIPVPGTEYGLNYAVQLTDLEIDFHPGNRFDLPPQLHPPLAAQSFAIRLEACAGLGCPGDDILQVYIPPPPDPKARPERPEPDKPLTPIKTRRLICFCLKVFVVGRIEIREYWGKPYLELILTGLEIVNIRPEPLESIIECYLRTVLKLSVLPGLRVLLETAAFDLKESIDNLTTSVFVSLLPTPESTDVPNNPAIEKDMLKAFVNVEVTT